MKKTIILALSLALSPALLAQTYTYTGAPDLIPDNDIGNPVCTVINVPEGTVSGELRVEFALLQTWLGDLNITLESPDAASNAIFLRDRATINAGGAGDSSDLDPTVPITFVDSAATAIADMGIACGGSAVVGVDPTCMDTDYVPSAPLSTFDGESAIGDWTACVGDGAAGDLGELTSWSLIGDGTLPVELQGFSID